VLDVRQRADDLSQFLQRVDEAAGLIGFDARSNRGLVQRGLQFVELLCAGQERKVSLLMLYTSPPNARVEPGGQKPEC